MKNNIYTISQGTRFGTSSSLLGVILIIVGIIAIIIPYYIIGIIIMIVGAVITFDSYGLDFNLKDKTFRRYNKIIFFKTGYFEDFSKFNLLKLKRTNESVTMFSRSGEKSFSQKTYDVYLFSNEEEILLLEFKRNISAQKFMKDLSEKLFIDCKDEVQEIQQKSVQRRAGRRR